MPRKLLFKICPYCGTRIYGVRRKDRKAFHYAPRCANCARKNLSPGAYESRCKQLDSIRVERPVGSTRIHDSGRGCFYIEEKTENGEWEYQHRLRANPQPGEHVHHKDEDGLNNDPGNLQPATPAKHRALHKLDRWSHNFDFCQRCGKTERPHDGHGLCDRCGQQYRAEKRGYWRNPPKH